MNKLRKIVWNIMMIIALCGYFYCIIKEDMYSANFMLIIGLISDIKLDIIKLKERNMFD